MSHYVSKDSRLPRRLGGPGMRLNLGAYGFASTAGRQRYSRKKRVAQQIIEACIQRLRCAK